MADEVQVKKRSAAQRIREKLLGLQGERATIELSGETFLLIAPTQKKRGQIQQACLRYKPIFKDGKPTNEFDVNMDNAELKVRALVACLRDPETELPVFQDEADLEAIRESPVAWLYDQLQDAAVKLFNPNPELVEKNSSPVPGASSSTASPQS